ncbi:MAG: endonuclease [Flavobacteriales bacterium]|nr:endonuclease [Flavobacteriales bacterium]
MMKKVVLILLLFPFSVLAQIPEGYYDNAIGLTGEALKNALNDIIDGHTEYPYTSTGTDVWDILKETDKDTINTDNVILVYSGQSVNAAQEYNTGAGWTRELVWAKSRGDFGTNKGVGTDIHHLKPADVSVNSARNNRWFAECSEEYLDGGITPTGSYTSSSKWVWKPRNEVKGDIARMIFYMATRYEGENGEVDLEIIDYLPSDNDSNEPIFAKLSDLLLWHIEDPVDSFEINRHEIIYSYQNNRNPYIDHPEYASIVFDVVTSTKSINNTKFVVYPNPSSGVFTIESDEEIIMIEVYNSIGALKLTTSKNEIDLSRLISGLYTFRIKFNEDTMIKKVLLD